MDYQQLSKFELRQLCCFMAVVKAENNFSEAAKSLYIQQAPLSQRILALEKMLKVKLFNRNTRPLTLTDARKVFLEEVKESLSHLERAIDQAQRVSRGEIGRLVVGMNSALANSVLPEILQNFRSCSPNVQLILRELTAKQQIQELRDCQIDVGFEHLPNDYEQDADLIFLPIVQDALVIALPEKHRLAALPEIPLQALAKEAFVLPSSENAPSLHNETIRLCKDAGFSPEVAQEATWLITVLSLVAGGVGVALLHSNVQNLQRTGVVYKTIQGANLKHQLAAVWRKERESSSSLLREFLKIIKNVISI
ncbi:MAG: LysR substrate-binding domain-containing protein [Nostoc sp.]|uniref:LysR substrate-binding domain-containing protein n=1 Tax=Nostoc sp. TaxID=1180 RepID=UPI002FF80EAB